MFDHVTLGASDREATRHFYATVLAALDRTPDVGDPTRVEWGDLSIQQAGDGRAVTTGLHIGFAAPSHAHVDAFWRAGVEAGFRDDGPPGPRAEYGDDYYGGFLLDPDGNSAEAVVHDNVLDRPGIDHLWVRVADHAAARRFYDIAAPACGFAVAAEAPGLTRYRRAPRDGSITFLEGEPTSPFHLAFAVESHDAVRAFHRAATEAGHPDNGAPGERPEYHPGYFGAFVLDPGGHNVEAVVH